MITTTTNKVGETTAIIYYYASFSLPSAARVTGYEGIITITNNNKIVIESNDSSIKIENLKSGTEYIISGSLTCYYTITTTTTNSDGSTTTNVIKGNQTASLGTCYIYTNPGAWSWSKYIAVDDTISTNLQAKYINNWVDHLSQWESWKTQSNLYNNHNTYFDTDNYLKNNTNNGGLRVYSGEVICLGWFNNCIDKHPNNPSRLVKNSTDIISLENFQKLDFKGSGEVYY